MSSLTRRIPWLGDDPDGPFPAVANALREPDGLLAAGGDLSATRLLNAYRHGIFPWFSEGQPLLWWCPDPRTVFRTDTVRLSSRFRRSLRGCRWVVRADTAFEQVLGACATVLRNGQHGTWITPAMQSAYLQLHRLGHAHSIEVLDDDRLVGGLYGVAIGRMFFGESMFSGASGGSKLALAALAHRLAQWNWPLIDAQVHNPHLASMGAESWPRDRFLARLDALVDQPEPAASWASRFDWVGAPDLSN